MNNKRTKTNKNKKAAVPKISEKSLNAFRNILVVALLIIIFYPPFLRGLFFEREQLPAAIFVFIIFTAFFIYKYLSREKVLLQTPLDYVSLGFVIIYLVSIFFAVSTRHAIAEWIKYCMFIAIFLIISDLARAYKTRQAIIWTIVASTVGICLLGIDGAAGGHISSAFNSFFKQLGAKHDVFFDLFNSGRVFSTLQYPNALAAYLIGIYLILVTKIMGERNKFVKCLSGALSFMVLLTFVFTTSRGAYGVMAASAVLFFIVLPAGTRIKAIVSSLVSIIPFIIVAIPIAGYIAKPEGMQVRIWIITLLGMAASALLALSVKSAASFLGKISWKIYAVSCTIIFVAAAGLFVYAVSVSVPLELKHASGEKDRYVGVMRSIQLEADKEYKLVYDVDSCLDIDKPYAYTVNIRSRSKSNILFNSGNTVLANYPEKATGGFKTRQIEFKVPKDSSLVDIQFFNYYEGTGAVFKETAIIDVNSGKTVKKIALKNKYLPESITFRFQNMSVSSSSLQRSEYYKDGFKIIKDYWITGAGGRAWEFLYTSYQSYYYLSKQAHNYLLQIGIECGIWGILLLTSLICSVIAVFLFSCINRRKENECESVLQSAIFVGVIALFAHSFMDFDLSISAVFLLLWQLIALMNALYKESLLENSTVDAGVDSGPAQKRSIIRIYYEKALKSLLKIRVIETRPLIAVCAIIPALILSFLFVQGMNYSSRAISALRNSDGANAVNYMKKAASVDAFMPNYKADYANLLLRSGSVTQNDLNEANENIAKAESRSKYNADVLASIANYHVILSEFDKGLKTYDHAISLRPYSADEWDNKIKAYYSIIANYLNKRDMDSAFKYIDKAFGMIDEAKKVNQSNRNPFVFGSTGSGILEKLKCIKDNYDIFNNIDFSKVVFYNFTEMDVNNDGVPDQWIAANENVKISNVNEALLVENTQQNATNYFYSRNISFSAGKSYSISLKLNNADKVQKIPYYVNGISEKVSNMNKSGDEFLVTISVPQEFKPDKNYLRLYLPVSAKWEISSITIIEQ